MASSALPVYLCVLLLTAATGFRLDGGDHRICAFANSLQGAEPHPTNELRGVVQENGTIHCGRGSRCYGLWEKRANGEMQLLNQGCWTHVGNQQECYGDRCVLVAATPSQLQKASYRFCCCSRDLCNANFTEAPPTADTPALRPMKADSRDDVQTGPQLTPEKTVLVALVTVAIAAILIMAMFLGYRMMKRKQKYSLSAVDVMEVASSESAVDLDNLKLLELIGRGRYGAVYRGSLNERCVAVKLFSSANRQNYGNERSIYTLLQQHDNIARFLTADERTVVDGRPEFLILMELYPHGCLSRYLSLHAVDWLTCCRMTHGVTRGLAFLHTELCRGDQYKPAIAHRDLTSRNVLVRADLSCVLADFGLSMRLTGGRPCRPEDDDTMTISEVGTVRYMSPEVLGGALNLRDCEAALKQVDVYALGLLYWESFRRCSDLFPGEAVPDFQLAFQAELGNHPSFEDMQVLVVREKFRPRFPEVWKENSLVLRSLKETMEDCWDQDAEARLTAQCAEERLAELTLLGTHTAVHNHRNLSLGQWSPQVGSASSYIEDLQVGVVKNLQGDPYLASVIRTTTGGTDGVEKNRNSINYERQQARLSDGGVSTANALPPATVLCTISESQHAGGAVLSVPVCLPLTEEDLEATKLHPKEVDKNLREASDENLMEHSQKLFGSELQSSTRLLHQILHGPEVNSSAPRDDPGVLGGEASLPSTSTHALPKQQNLPQRPSSLRLLPKAKEPGPASRLKPGKLKSNQRQVETGVAKMNTVNIVTAAEPQLVTTVTNNINTKSGAAIVASGCSAGVPTLVTNTVMGGGRTNPAGPQVTGEDEEKTEGGRLNLLNFSPDEHEPLLRREQPPAESEPLHHHHHSRTTSILMGRGSNSNNNNNRLALGSKVKPGRTRHVEMGPEGGVSSPEPDKPSSGKPLPLQAPPTTKETETVLTPGCTESLKDQLVQSVIPYLGDPSSGSATAPEVGGQASQVEDTEAMSSSSEAKMVDTLTFSQKCSLQEAPDPGPPASDPGPPASDPRPPASNPRAPDSDPQPSASDPKASASDPEAAASDPEAPASDPGPPASDTGVPLPEVQAPETPALEPQDLETTGLAAEASVLEPADVLQGPSLEPQTTGLLRSQVGQKARRPERPCSLDLSLSCISSDDVSGTDHGRLSVSGEKIKRRVKTPYTLKKWRPASWVVSTDTALDPEFEFNTSSSSSSSHAHFSSSLHRGVGIPKINQSKSSMAVFLVGGGATATTTSEPDGMTCF